MKNTIYNLLSKYDKPFLYVDFNEFLDKDIIMLSQKDINKDLLGNLILLYEGLEVIGYEENEEVYNIQGNIDVERDDIIVEGICVKNNTDTFKHVKWLLKINTKGVQYVSDILNLNI